MSTMQHTAILSSISDQNKTTLGSRLQDVQAVVDCIDRHSTAIKLKLSTFEKADKLLASIKVPNQALGDLAPKVPSPSDAALAARIRFAAVLVSSNGLSANTEKNIARIGRREYLGFMNPDCGGRAYCELYGFTEPEDGAAAHAYYRWCKRAVVYHSLALAAGTVSNSAADRVFETMQAHDGGHASIGFKEFMGWFGQYQADEKTSMTREQQRATEALFKEYDADRSAQLNKFEFRAFFNGLVARGDIVTDANASAAVFRRVPHAQEPRGARP